uniref:hypothetical protein n=1 Tax=Klebsiella pneumoniae TaxID=573 RepID=UPI003075C324
GVKNVQNAHSTATAATNSGATTTIAPILKQYDSRQPLKQSQQTNLNLASNKDNQNAHQALKQFVASHNQENMQQNGGNGGGGAKVNELPV